MYKELYKQNINHVEDLQESRRKAILSEQKLKRATLQDQQRNMEGVIASVSNDCKSKNIKYKHRNFRDVYGLPYELQLSEWMRERPVQLSDWLLVPCPKGQRCMIVACNGRTEMYNKGGRWQMRFRSGLPGDGGGRKVISILDCVFEKKLNTFYVLDALALSNQNLLECEAQFRFFWLRSKFEELELGNLIAGKNERRFILLEKHDFEDTADVSIALERFPYWLNNSPEIDGYLFYHKEANYCCGTTPLVGWLFPFMVPELLEIGISQEHAKPSNYANNSQYIQEFDAKRTKKILKKISGTMEQMDATQIDENDDSSLMRLLQAERDLELGEEINLEQPELKS